jgi:hypothetical protein
VAVPRSTELAEESIVEVAISPRGGGTAPGKKGGAGAIDCWILPRGLAGLLIIIWGLGTKGWEFCARIVPPVKGVGKFELAPLKPEDCPGETAARVWDCLV